MKTSYSADKMETQKKSVSTVSKFLIIKNISSFDHMENTLMWKCITQLVTFPNRFSLRKIAY